MTPLLASRMAWYLPITLRCLFVVRPTKAVFLELRQEYLAMGCTMRCHINFHLFDTKKLVQKQRTAGAFRASKLRRLNCAGWGGTY
jgi:hypothetical protein